MTTTNTLTPPQLTAEEKAEVDAYLAELQPLDDQRLADKVGIPLAYVAQFRAIMYPQAVTA